MNKLFLVLIIVLASCSSNRRIYSDKSQTNKLCFLGDIGHDSPAQEVVAKALLKEDCSKIYFLGDLIYPDGIKDAKDPLLEQNFFRYYRRLFAKNKNLKINLLLGNHDYAANPDAWLDIAKQNENYFFPSNYYIENLGGLCIVSLDTNGYIYPRKIMDGLRQTLWLSQLKDYMDQNCVQRIALTHHPLENSAGVLEQFIKTLILGEMDYHIAGHIHALRDNGVLEDTRLIISGTGGDVTSGSKLGYFIIEHNKESISAKMRVLEAPGL